MKLVNGICRPVRFTQLPGYNSDFTTAERDHFGSIVFQMAPHAGDPFPPGATDDQILAVWMVGSLCIMGGVN